MIHFIHRGKGGRYSHYIEATIKKVNRLRPIEISSKQPVKPGYKVAIDQSGAPMSVDMLRSFLTHDEVTFLLGDSRGLPAEWISQADFVASVTTLPTSHEVEAAIVSDQIEKMLLTL